MPCAVRLVAVTCKAPLSLLKVLKKQSGTMLISMQNSALMVKFLVAKLALVLITNFLASVMFNLQSWKKHKKLFKRWISTTFHQMDF